MKIKETLLSLFLAGSLMLPKMAKATNVNGYFIDTPNCSTKVWTPVSPDTQKTLTNNWGKFAIETQDFANPPQIGDTLYFEGGWNLGGKAKTLWELKASENQIYDLNLDKHTGCIKEIIDTSGLHDSIPLMCEYWIEGFLPETTNVDTSFQQGLTHYYDLHIPFDTLQAQQGVMAHYKLFKKVIDSPDTLYVKEDSFQINKDAFDAQLIRLTDTFPKEKIIIGVEENNQPFTKKERIVKQSHGTRFDIKGPWELYDLIGNKVSEYQTDTNAYKSHNLGMYPNGHYFLKSKDGKELIEQIIIFKK